MKLLEETVRPGLKALIDTSGLSEKILAYRFCSSATSNAAGRMESHAAVELLLASSYQGPSFGGKVNDSEHHPTMRIFSKKLRTSRHRVDQGDKMLVWPKKAGIREFWV